MDPNSVKSSMMPTRAIFPDGPWARAASGHAAVPPRNLMNSRRLIATLAAGETASYLLKPVYWKGAMSALGQKRRLRFVGLMSALPPKADMGDVR
jgi:hypothetical protein